MSTSTSALPASDTDTLPLTDEAQAGLSDISAHDRVVAELQTRLRQQAAVAAYGLRAVATPDLARLMDELVRGVADTLQVEFCKVLELLPGGEWLRVCAGVGWRDGTVGQVL